MYCCLLKINVSPNDANFSVFKPGVDISQNYYRMLHTFFCASNYTKLVLNLSTQSQISVMYL